MATVAQNAFYEAFKSELHLLIPHILPGLLPRIILHVFGLFGNLNIIYAVYHNIGLQSCSGILLAIIAGANIVHQSSHEYFAYLLFTNVYFVKLRICVYVQTVPIIGFHLGLQLAFFLALDRLICVSFPVTRHKISNQTYITVYLSIASIISATLIILGYIQLYAHDPDKLVICQINNAMPGYVERLWFYIGSTYSSLSLICYFIVWIILKRSKHKNTSTSKMFKSLVIICTIIAFCWIFVFVTFLFIGSSKLSIVDAWLIRYNLGVSLTFASCCNYYVLWLCSRDFRIAFKAPFKRWFNKSRVAANVVAVNPQLSSSNKRIASNQTSSR